MKQFSPSMMVRLFGNAIAASGSETSEVISGVGMDGYFSLQVQITGDGTAKFEVLSSNNGVDFLDINSDILASQTKSTGPGSDGKNMASFTLVPSMAFKIKVTETGGAQGITPTAWLKVF